MDFIKDNRKSPDCIQSEMAKDTGILSAGAVWEDS